MTVWCICLVVRCDLVRFLSANFRVDSLAEILYWNNNQDISMYHQSVKLLRNEKLFIYLQA